MPFAAVLTRGQSTILSPPIAVLRTEGHIWARSMSSCYGILPIHKPPTPSVKESRFFSANPPRPHHLHAILISSVLRPASRLLGRDNACPWPGHLLTVEMLRGPARDGPLL